MRQVTARNERSSIERVGAASGTSLLSMRLKAETRNRWLLSAAMLNLLMVARHLARRRSRGTRVGTNDAPTNLNRWVAGNKQGRKLRGCQPDKQRRACYCDPGKCWSGHSARTRSRQTERTHLTTKLGRSDLRSTRCWPQSAFSTTKFCRYRSRNARFIWSVKGLVKYEAAVRSWVAI
jgi:hypothetical protein